jgi:hypothetical protein
MAAKAKKPRERRIRKLRIVLGEVNVFSQPHSPQRYLQAFDLLNTQKAKVPFHGHRYIELGTLGKLDDDRLPDAITGDFYIFSKINFDDPWLNLARNAEATDADLEKLNIPANLAPEFRRFRYVFDPHRHRLFFETLTRDRHHISPKAFGQALGRLLQSTVPTAFTEVNVIVIPDKSVVDTILQLNKLRRIELVIHRTNPDDDEFEQEVLDELNAENVGTLEQTLIKAPGVPAITPSELTRKLAHLAARFGFVKAWGKNDDGAPIHKDTKSEPKEHPVVYRETEDSLDKAVEYIASLTAQPDQQNPQ